MNLIRKMIALLVLAGLVAIPAIYNHENKLADTPAFAGHDRLADAPAFAGHDRLADGPLYNHENKLAERPFSYRTEIRG